MAIGTHAPNTGSATNRNLIEACKIFYDKWLPINGEALEKVREGLASRAYELDEDFFFQDLKADIGLFAYFLRQARRKVQLELGKSTSLDMNPRDLFTNLSSRGRSEIFEVDIKRISSHDFSKAESFQAQQFKELLVSTSATEALTETQALDGLLGYSVSSLHQIGRALIAWNYPRIFEESLKKTGDIRKLDIELTVRLGFSPELLVIALARDWGLSREIRSAIGDQSAKLAAFHPAHEKVQNVSQMLSKLYDVGATLARAQNSAFNPNGDEDWHNAKHAVESLLGPNGIKEIQQRVKENCFFYLQTAPEIFESVTKLEPLNQNALRALPELAAQNRYLRYCPKEARELLVQLYQKMSAKEIDKADAIKELMKSITPLIGFERGAVYLLEPENFQLTARIKVGSTPLEIYRPVHAFSVSTRGNNPIGQAYHCNSPIIQSDYAVSGHGDTCFASVLGVKQRLGVLYLEPEEKLSRSPDANLLQRFKAIVVAFQDFLGIV